MNWDTCDSVSESTLLEEVSEESSSSSSSSQSEFTSLDGDNGKLLSVGLLATVLLLRRWAVRAFCTSSILRARNCAMDGEVIGREDLTAVDDDDDADADDDDNVVLPVLLLPLAVVLP